MIFLSIGLLSYVLLKIYQRKKIASLKRKDRINLEKRWNDLFEKCLTRVDYERIYASRQEWLSLGVVDEYKARTFFDTIDKIQYAPTWGEVDMMNIENSFDVIRESFKK